MLATSIPISKNTSISTMLLNPKLKSVSSSLFFIVTFPKIIPSVATASTPLPSRFCAIRYVASAPPTIAAVLRSFA